MAHDRAILDGRSTMGFWQALPCGGGVLVSLQEWLVCALTSCRLRHYAPPSPRGKIALARPHTLAQAYPHHRRSSTHPRYFDRRASAGTRCLISRLFPLDTSAFGLSGCMAARRREGEGWGARTKFILSGGKVASPPWCRRIRSGCSCVLCVRGAVRSRGLPPRCSILGNRKQRSTKCCFSPRGDYHLLCIVCSL